MAAHRSRTRFRAWLTAGGTLLAALLLGGCGLPSFGMPSSITKQGGRTYSLWQVMFALAIVVGGLVWGLIFWSVIRYRRRRGDDSVPENQSPYNIPIEVLYTVVPILLVIGIFVGSVGVQHRNDSLSKKPDVNIEVVGFQWQWQFRYLDSGFTVTGNSVAGNPPVMVLPVGSTIRFKLRAADVAHSFWVPKFLMKRDLIPGIPNQIDVTTQRQLDTYEGRCAEYCGLDHWRMNFKVKVVSQTDYRSWLRDQRTKR